MRRVYLNIVAFAVISTALIAWSATNFLRLDVIEKPYFVVAEFAESPGLRPGYEVTYLGHSVGRIRGVDLVPGRSEVRLAIDRDVELPAAVTAAARRRSAIGEPYVDLAPAIGTDPHAGARLADGDRITLAATSSPLQYGDLFRSLDSLVDTIDPAALGSVVEELAAGVDGRGDDIRRIVVGTDELTRRLAENGDDLDALIDGVADVTEVLATHRGALGSGLESLAELATALDRTAPGIENLAREAGSALAVFNEIVDASDHAIICVVDGAAVLDAILDEAVIDSIRSLLQRSAAFVDVIGLLQDARDGVFRLMVSPSGGNPPTVEYVERAPYPEVPSLASCPQYAFSKAGASAADEAPPGAGGRRPGPDGSIAGVDRPPAGADDLASDSSDASAGEAALIRLLSASWPWVPIALIAGILGWVAVGRFRERGST